MARTRESDSRKVKKSYSLSVGSVKFVEQLRKTRRASSTSSVLDDIVQAYRRAQQRRSLERDIAQYYSSLPDEQVEEEAAWGEFAISELAKSRH
jgi:hypothetical protein